MFLEQTCLLGNPRHRLRHDLGRMNSDESIGSGNLIEVEDNQIEREACYCESVNRITKATQHAYLLFGSNSRILRLSTRASNTTNSTLSTRATNRSLSPRCTRPSFNSGLRRRRRHPDLYREIALR